MRIWIRAALLASLVIAIGGCSNEISKSASPVQLVLNTVSQPIARFDIMPNAANCTDGTIVTFTIENRIKNPSSPTSNSSLLDVHLSRYHVHYVRTDGGKLVPADYDRALDQIVGAGTTSSTVVFHITDFHDIFSFAPFAALLPQNGGKDPDTGSSVVKMNIVVTVIGETLAGDNVSSTLTVPVDFCYNCGGCQP